MAVEEVRAVLRRQLEATYGMEGAAILMDRPPGRGYESTPRA
jgi:hypothetical protein